MDLLETVQINPEFLMQYMDLNKNAVMLHMTMKALTQDGKLERNIKRFGQLMNRSRDRVREAESELKRKQLLSLHWNGDRRFWIH